MTTNKSKNVFNIAVKGNLTTSKISQRFFGMNNKNQKYNLVKLILLTG